MEIAAVIFVLVMCGAAYLAFRLLKRAFKMAIRMLIVFLILAVALIGGASLWMYGSGSGTKPPASRKQP